MAQFRFVLTGEFVEFYDGSQLVTKLRNTSQEVNWFYDDADLSELEFEIDGHKYKTVPSQIEIDGTTLTTADQFDGQIVNIFPNVAGADDIITGTPGIDDVLEQEQEISDDRSLQLNSRVLSFSGNLVTFLINDTTGHFRMNGLNEFTDNVAALAGGVPSGGLYYTESGGERILKIAYD
jgi:hypothetical protein